MKRTLLLSCALVASIAQVWASTSLDANRAARVVQHPVVPAWPVAWMNGGMRRRSAADLQWLRAAAYAGSSQFERSGRPALAPLLQLVVALDPTELNFYRLGGLLLASEPDATRQAVALLSECTVRFPEYANCPFYSGVLRLTGLQDARGAAQDWRTARARPGAPAYLDGLLQRLSVKDGRCLVAVYALRQLMEATPAHARGPLQEQDRRLRLECTLQQVEAAVALYRERHQVPPPNVEALVQDGVLPHVPVEPYGKGIDILPDGSVRARAAVPRVNLGALPGAEP